MWWTPDGERVLRVVPPHVLRLMQMSAGSLGTNLTLQML